MATEIEGRNIGTQDLEKGLVASRSSCFLTIAINAMLVLLLLNASALTGWVERKPSSQASIWLAEVARGLETLTKVSPFEWGARFRRALAIDGSDSSE